MLTKFKIIIVIGPSGVGKNWFSEIISKKINFHHLDIDVSGHFSAYKLKGAWDIFIATGNCTPFVRNLENTITHEECNGIILSLPSTKSSQFSQERIEFLRTQNVSTILLWGKEEFCINSRNERDSKNDEGINKSQYNRKNGMLFKEFSKSTYNEIRIEMFKKNGDRPLFEEIINQVKAKDLI